MERVCVGRGKRLFFLRGEWVCFLTEISNQMKPTYNDEANDDPEDSTGEHITPMMLVVGDACETCVETEDDSRYLNNTFEERTHTARESDMHVDLQHTKRNTPPGETDGNQSFNQSWQIYILV